MIGHKIIAQTILKFISSFGGLISAMLVARAFMPEKIGEVIFIIGICSFATMFFDFGFNTAANTKIAQDKFTAGENIGTLLIYKAILSVIYILLIITVYFLNKAKINNIGLDIFLIIAIALYIDGVAASLQQYVVGRRHFYKFMINNFAAQMGSILFLIFISVYHPTQLNYALSYLIGSIVLISVALYYLRNIKIEWHIKKEVFKSYWDFAKPFLILVPIQLLIGNAENIILPYLISVAGLAIFTFGLKLYNMIQIVKKTFTSYIYSYVANLVGKCRRDELVIKLDNLAIITHIFAAILVAGLINRSEFLNTLLFGEAYRASSIITQLMCFYLYTDFILNIYSNVVYAKAKQKLIIPYTISSGILLLLSLAILVPQEIFNIQLLGLNYVGMPLAKLVNILTIGALSGILITRKLIGTAFLYTHLKYFLIFIAYIIADYYFMGILRDNFVWIFISWFAGIIIYFGIVYIFCINREIRNQMISLFSLKKLKEGLKEI